MPPKEGFVNTFAPKKLDGFKKLMYKVISVNLQKGEK